MSLATPLDSLDIDSMLDGIYTNLDAEPDPTEDLPPPPKKRKRNNGQVASESEFSVGDDDDDNNEDGPTFFSPVVTQNVSEKVKRYAEARRLKSEQKAEVEHFLREPLLVQLGKIYVNQLVAQNEKANAIASGPSFKIDKVLEENVTKYSAAVILSPKLRTYKGDAPKNIMLDILKQKHFGLYDGIERNASDWKQVIRCVNNGLTQTRAALKKLLRSSLSYEVKVDSTDQTGRDGRPKKISEWRPLNKEAQQSIYALTQEMVQLAGSNTASAALCARVALMRLQFRSSSGDNFWDRLDARLLDIYRKTKEEPIALRKVFEGLLRADRMNHGVDEQFDIPEGESEFQAGVNELLEAQAANVASSATANGIEST